MKIGGKNIHSLAQFMKEFRWSSEECQELLCCGELLNWLMVHGHAITAERMSAPLSRGEMDIAIAFLYEEWLYQSGTTILDLDSGKESPSEIGTISLHAHGFISPEAARIADLPERRKKFVEHFVQGLCELNRHVYSPGEPLVQLWWKRKPTERLYKLLDGEDGDYIARLYPLEPNIAVVDYFDRVYKLSRASNGLMIPYGIIKDLSDGDRMEIICPMTVYNPVDRIMGLVPPETKNILTRMVITIDQSGSGFGRRYKNYVETLNTALGELPMTGPLLNLGRRSENE